jgi:hypothetical protein
LPGGGGLTPHPLSCKKGCKILTADELIGGFIEYFKDMRVITLLGNVTAK